MKFVRQTLKPVSFFLAIFVLMISGPFQSVHAAMIGTESVLDTSKGQQARVYLKSGTRCGSASNGPGGVMVMRCCALTMPVRKTTDEM